MTCVVVVVCDQTLLSKAGGPVIEIGWALFTRFELFLFSAATAAFRICSGVALCSKKRIESVNK